MNNSSCSTSSNDLDEEIDGTLTKFAYGIKLGGEMDISKGRSVLQRDLDRLEEWASENCMEYKKEKCKLLHLGQRNQRVQYRPGSVWLGSILAERDLGVLVDNKLNMSQQCIIAVVQANHSLGCIHSGITGTASDMIMILYSVFVNTVSSYGLHNSKKKNMDRLKRVQRRAMKMIKGKENPP